MSRTDLKNATKENTTRSSNPAPTNITTDAKVVSVHDGDTCDLVIIRKRSLERFKCRLAAIDTPELKAGTTAKKARDFLAWLSIGNDPASFPRSTQPWSDVELQNQLDANKTLVYAEFQGVGGYGRPLVNLKKTSGDKVSFNDLLIQYGYAEPYSK